MFHAVAAQVWAAALSPVEQEPPLRPIGQRSVAALAVALFVAGATLTFLGDGAVLAIGVIALTAFIAVGAAELLRPEALE